METEEQWSQMASQHHMADIDKSENQNGDM